MVPRRLLARGAQLALLWLGLSFGLFALVHAMPGSPEERLLATHPDMSAAQVARMRRLQSLDLSLTARYRCWLLGRSAACPSWPSARGVLEGELGWSVAHQAPVAELIRTRAANTAALMVPTFLLALLGAVLLGARAGLSPGSGWDRLASGLAVVGLAVPAHWLGLLAVLVFAVGLGWLPAGGVQSLVEPGIGSRVAHLVLPVSVLSLYYLARWTRYVRRAVRAERGAPYLDGLRALGLTEGQVVFRHALPNALFPLATVVAQSTPVLFSGALVVERIFAYPGMGLLVFESVEAHDDLVAVTVFLIYAALTFAASALADAVYVVLDPRARAPEASR